MSAGESATEYLEKIYFDEGHPAGYSSGENLYKWARKKFPVTRKFVENWLSGIESHSLHKPVRRKFPRNRVVVDSIGEQADVDLMDMQNVAKYNDGFRYVIICIDIFSRFLRVRCIKSKKGPDVANGLKEIFDEQNFKRMRSDKGGEFWNPSVRALLKQKNVLHMGTQNTEVKANYAEICIKSLKKRVYRYFTEKQTYKYYDKIQKFVEAYNNSYHRGIKMPPAKVKAQNSKQLWFEQFAEPMLANPKKVINSKNLKVGDWVRLSHIKRTFQRAYHISWTGELFQIVDVDKSRRIFMYRVKAYDGEPITGNFYSYELVKVRLDPHQLYKVEKILKTRKKGKKKEHLVKFLYWPPKYNQWLPAEQVQDLQNE